jgi:succinate dehydrogenase / fumarate reductase, membrane anchor subunit
LRAHPRHLGRRPVISLKERRHAVQRIHAHRALKGPRVTALANVPLAIAFIIIVVMLQGADHARMLATMSHPLVALLMLLFVVSGVIHMRLGMQVIIEDYIHSEGQKIAMLIGNTFFAIVIGAACIFSVLKMAFGS